MPTDKPRYSITLEEDMLKEIEDFRFNNRYSSKNQATIDLIQAGLDILMKEIKEDDNNKSFQNIEKFSSKEKSIIEKYRSINDEGQEKIIDYIDDLIETGKYKKSYSHELDKKEA